MNESLPAVTIYTDGGCRPNPGPGGWGAVLLYPGRDPVELSGGKREATNNRMEMVAAIEAFGALDGPHRVELYTDSTYLKKGITEWLSKWRAKGWKTAAKKDVKNRDLWEELDKALQIHDVPWNRTQRHAGDRSNELAAAPASTQRPSSRRPRFRARRCRSTIRTRCTSSPRLPTRARKKPDRGEWCCALQTMRRA